MSWEDILKSNDEYTNEFDAIEAAQKLANETGRNQNVRGIIHIEEDGDSETEFQITEEEVFAENNTWLVKTVEPKRRFPFFRRKVKE